MSATGAATVILRGEEFGNTEVCKFDVTILVQENILRLDIPYGRT
jgi:hypothetical protein